MLVHGFTQQIAPTFRTRSKTDVNSAQPLKIHILLFFKENTYNSSSQLALSVVASHLILCQNVITISHVIPSAFKTFYKRETSLKNAHN